MQIVKKPVAKPIDPAVKFQGLPMLPGALHKAGFLDMAGLIQHAEFAKQVFFSRLAQALETLRLAPVNASHVAQPVVDQAEFLIEQCRAHAAAAVMPDNHNVLYLQDAHSVLDDGQAVEIRVVDDIGHVSMNEDLARSQAENLVRRNTAVRTTDPEILGCLDVDELAEKFGLAKHHSFGPTPVRFEKVFEAHA